MLTLKDLSEYDVKNIDFGKLQKRLLHRKDILANIAVIVIMLYAMNNILAQRKLTVQKLQKEIEAMDTKTTAIVQLESVKNKVKDFANSLPQGLATTDQMIDRINKMAVLNNVQILSFSPGARKETEYLETVSLKLKIVTDNYADMGRFIYDIENSPNNLRVESWSMAGVADKYRRGSAMQDEAQKKLNADLEVVSLVIKK